MGKTELDSLIKMFINNDVDVFKLIDQEVQNHIQ